MTRSDDRFNLIDLNLFLISQSVVIINITLKLQDEKKYRLIDLLTILEKSFESGSSQELRLIHWERLRFWDYDRYIIQGKKRKQKETGKMVSVRTTVMQMNRGAEMSSEIAAAISTYYHTTQDHLARVESKADRLKIVEEKVDRVLSLIKELNLKVFCYYYYYFVRIFGYNEIYIIYYLTNVYWFRNVTITYNHLLQSWIVKDF